MTAGFLAQHILALILILLDNRKWGEITLRHVDKQVTGFGWDWNYLISILFKHSAIDFNACHRQQTKWCFDQNEICQNEHQLSCTQLHANQSPSDKSNLHACLALARHDRFIHWILMLLQQRVSSKSNAEHTANNADATADKHDLQLCPFRDIRKTIV